MNMQETQTARRPNPPGFVVWSSGICIGSLITFIGLPAFQSSVGVLAMLFIVCVASANRTKHWSTDSAPFLGFRIILLASFIGLAVFSHQTGDGSSVLLPLGAGLIACLLFVWAGSRHPREK